MAGMPAFVPATGLAGATGKVMDVGLRGILLGQDWEVGWVDALEARNIHSSTLFRAIGLTQQAAVKSILTIIQPDISTRPADDTVEQILLFMKLGAGWDAASKVSSSEADPGAELVLTSSDRSSVFDSFNNLYRHRVDPFVCPHDSMIARLLLEIRSRSLSIFKLSKVKFAGDERPRSAVLKLAPDGSGQLVSVSSDTSVDGVRAFFVALRGLMIAYSLIGSFVFTPRGGVPAQWCSLDSAMAYVFWIEKAMFDAAAGSRITVPAAMEADRSIRSGWSKALRDDWSQFSMSQLIDRSLQSDAITYFAAAISKSQIGKPVAVASPDKPDPIVKTENFDKPEIDRLKFKDRKRSRITDGSGAKPGPKWTIKSHSGKPVCRDFNMGKCSDASKCGRSHVCAVCAKSSCRASSHE